MRLEKIDMIARLKSSGPLRPVRTAAILLLAAVLLLSFSGCGLGLIYTCRIEPFDTDLSETPVVMTAEKGDTKQLRYSVIGARWDSNAIGEIAKANGIETVYFADIEKLSVLLGIWSQRWIIIYGE